MNEVLKEAERLWKWGFALVWIQPNSKAPGYKWNRPRESWEKFRSRYSAGSGIGVQTGKHTELPDGRFLAMIDLDMKSKDKSHRGDALDAFRKLFPSGIENNSPCVASPNGLRFLVSTKRPIESKKQLAHGPDTKVYLPAAEITEQQKAAVRSGLLTEEELKEGYRIRPAWEIDLMGSGRQGVLPPSIHPDTNKPYTWANPLELEKIYPLKIKQLKELEVIESNNSPNSDEAGEFKKFTSVPFDLCDTRLDPKWAEMIETGEGVEGTRHPFMHSCVLACLRAGFSDDEITSIFTDKDLYWGEYCFEKARTKNNRSRAAHWFKRYTLRKAKNEITKDSEVFEGLEETAPKLTREGAARQKTKLTHKDWKLRLERKPPPKGAAEGVLGAILPLLKNIVIILENAVSPAVFRRDLFQIKDFYGSDAPWFGARIGTAVPERAFVHIKSWLSKYWGFEPQRYLIEEAIIEIAEKNGFHPIQEKLLAAPAWDGIERLDTGWQRYFNVYVTDENREYLAQTFRKWMVASVTRIFEPGAKFDWMIVLEGPTGIGKTEFGEILFGEQYYLDGMPPLKDKDAVVNMQGQLCAEFGELSVLKNTALETIKSFLTRRYDKIRMPYGRLREDMPRQIVFIGTTEFDNYLRADEENRRFNPIETQQIEKALLKSEVAQLWAEALFIYQMGLEDSFYLSGEAKAYAKQLRREKFVEDEATFMADKIKRFILAWKNGGKNNCEWFNPTRFKSADLAENPGSPLEQINLDDRKIQFLGRALKIIGAKKLNKNGFWEIDLDKFSN